MKRPPLARRRNIGIISHIDAGKTTTTERILFYSGAIHRIGEVDDGSATTDWMAQERERGISITAAAVTCPWKDHEITLIDTPGHVDFTIEVERSLRVLDGAVAIFSAVEGVEPQSETVWRQADRFQVPRIAYVNKLDRTGADFGRAVAMMREKLGARTVLLQFPDGEGDRYRGQVDVLTGEFLSWEEADEGRAVHRRPAGGELAGRARELREAAAEAAADFDEGLMEAFLEGKGIGAEDIRRGLRRGVLACQLVPVFCGSSLRNRGVQPLLDAVLDYLPSPLDVPPARGHRPPKEGEGDGEAPEAEERPPAGDAPFSALVFKVQMDEGRRLTYLRVYSGRLASGAPAYNTARRVSERAARLFHMYSHKRERIEEVGPGDIAAAAGFKYAATGDTLCDEKHPIAFEPIHAPHPVISIAVEARDSAGAKKLEEALQKLEAEDPTFRARRDPDTGQVVMSGMGELHLDVLTRRIGEEFGVEVRVGKPRVVYRETIQRPDEAEATYDRELAGKAQYARVKVRAAPAPGKGVSVGSRVRALEEGGTLPRKLLQAALESLEGAADGGPMAGYAMTDVAIELADAHYDPARGTEAAFSLAASHAFIEACRRAGGVLLEPVMAVEAVTPEEFVGAVIGDLNARGGRIEHIEERGANVPLQIVRATVPLARMFGYSTALRSATQGRATFTMEFARYAKSEMAGV